MGGYCQSWSRGSIDQKLQIWVYAKSGESALGSWHRTGHEGQRTDSLCALTSCHNALVCFRGQAVRNMLRKVTVHHGRQRWAQDHITHVRPQPSIYSPLDVGLVAHSGSQSPLLRKKDSESHVKGPLSGLSETPCEHCPTLSSVEYSLILFPIKKTKGRKEKLSHFVLLLSLYFFFIKFFSPHHSPSKKLRMEASLSIFESD